MYTYIKRLCDIILSILGLIILSPLLLIVAMAIKIESPGPILFYQDRIGLNKKKFKIYKFRTMYTDAPKNLPTFELENVDQHITRVGQIIRKRSIDELPQLINIIKGDMSIIGPRPVVLTEIELIRERDKYDVFSVLPGLTGWAQINGRDAVTVNLKAKLDGEYVEKLNIINDAKIFFGTIAYVLKMEGIVEGVSEPLEKKTEI